MKRLFITIGTAALMLVAGTNVWIANQQNNVENELSLGMVEAQGIDFVESLIADYCVPKVITYLSHTDYTHWVPYGASYSKEKQYGHQVYEVYYQPHMCVDGGTERPCIVPSQRNFEMSRVFKYTSQYMNYNYGN